MGWGTHGLANTRKIRSNPRGNSRRTALPEGLWIAARVSRRRSGSGTQLSSDPTVSGPISRLYFVEDRVIISKHAAGFDEARRVFSDARVIVREDRMLEGRLATECIVQVAGSAQSRLLLTSL